MTKTLMITAVLLLLTLLLPKGALADEQRPVCCVCQTGTDPWIEKGFFSRGCSMWLNEQKSCTFKTKMPVTDADSTNKQAISLPPQCQGGQLILGYVGHWANWGESFNYVDQVIGPTMDKYKVDVEWHNTACSGLDDPKEFMKVYKSWQNVAAIDHDFVVRNNQIAVQYAASVNALNRQMDQQAQDLNKYSEAHGLPAVPVQPPPEVLPTTQPVPDIPYRYTGKMIYIANQVTSIGMWEHIIGTKANFWAKVDANAGTVTFPQCTEFENQSCETSVQRDEVGQCMDPDSQNPVSLTCCSVPDEDQNQSRFSSDSSDQDQIHYVSRWIRGNTCPKR